MNLVNQNLLLNRWRMEHYSYSSKKYTDSAGDTVTINVKVYKKPEDSEIKVALY